MMHRLPAPLASVLAVLAIVAGCGGDGDGGSGSGGGPADPPAKKTVAAVRECLDGDGHYKEVGDLEPSQSAGLVAKERLAVSRAARGSTAALTAKAGGPVEQDGTIIEAPVRLTELYFFGDAAAAQRAATRLEPGTRDAEAKALNGTRALGPILVVHYAFGIGDQPMGPGLNAEELAPVERCLRSTGYL